MKASSLSEIIRPVDCRTATPEADIKYLLTDSRRLSEPQGTLFFAIPTGRNSGERYIDALYQEGVRSFVVPAGCEVDYEDVNLWRVEHVVDALQRLAAYHRKAYDIPVVGITGSNGKTIVKDWLVQLLSPDRRVVASPKSYNSQIGVPLSVWQMSEGDQLALIEAGISEAGEMTHLQRIIQPTIGIFTNIGQAHDENFLTRGQKIAEKLQLFTHCETLIYCTDHKDIHSAVSGIESFRDVRCFTWGTSDENDVQLVEVATGEESTRLTYRVKATAAVEEANIPFVDRASIENAMHCLTFMVYLGYDAKTIAQRLKELTPVEMRLEMNEAIGNSLLINDSYSLDLNSLTIALDYLGSVRQHYNKTLIMSDMMQTGVPDRELYSQVAALIASRGITRFVGIGPALERCRQCFGDLEATFHPSTQDFIDTFNPALFTDQTILLKGARVFAFEQIAKLLQRKNHETVMEVNLDALVDNLNFYRSHLRPGTKLMAMVKASSYGAGRVEVASVLQFNHVDYLTVAYADEGVELRRGGITLPIMVMNPEEASFDDIIRYNLEPDIYSFRILDLFADRVRVYAGQTSEGRLSPFPIHIEFDTGMHRLGFNGDDVARLQERLTALSGLLEVRSVFSHLACADDPEMDDFTRRQIARLREWGQPFPGLKHILNSSGITRFPQAQMDMVRLGIGLYGVSPEPDVQSHLRQVSRLVTRISQIKDIPEGDTVGYNCRWRATRPSRIAILTIGYADGLHRGLGYGRGRVEIAGVECPVVGSVCMDMCFIDVTGVDCAEGDRAVVFGDSDLLQRNAAAANTIPYELLTSVSPRVKRIYYHQS
ncbi:MAG: bifunctional UDP-N-acetylmuramoyl-tripeptide:D-alanyl-D-alanine ligase/alanine racemase [Bacteroidales bacterium]|nr:bifunctional UDP-N-acetylmuramoyl-tripeptide:D-alanyl-D-alanine ligase/alanine racemase [Bacteroidales bacterium]